MMPDRLQELAQRDQGQEPQPQEQKFGLPIWQQLQKEGLSFDRLQDGRPIVKDEAGKEFELPIDQMLKQEGLDKKNIDIEWNSHDKAVPISPLTVEDRIRMSPGNLPGNTRYLKSKGYEPFYDEKAGEFKIKKDGVWYESDPSFLGKGTPYQKSAELVKDLAEGGPAAINFVSTQVGRAIGGILGAPLAPVTAGTSVVAGQVAGAALGGAASNNIKRILGKAFGTYETVSESEELNEMGLETIISAAGEVLPIAVKPLASMVIKGAKAISAGGSELTKTAFSKYIGWATKAGEEATTYLIDNAPKVMGAMKQFSQYGRDAVNQMAVSKEDTMRKFLDYSTKMLPKKYAVNLEKLINDSEGGLVFNPKKVMEKLYAQAETSGIGKLVTKDVVKTAESEIPDLTGAPKAVVSAKKSIFKLFGEKALNKREMQGLDTLPPLEPEATQALNKFFNKTKLYFNLDKNISGAQAARVISRMQRSLSEHLDPIFENGSETARGVASQIKDIYKKEIENIFDAHNLGDSYRGLSEPYEIYGNTVRWAKGLLRSGNPEAMTNIVNKLMNIQKPGGVRGGLLTAKEKLTELAGDEGAKLLDRVTQLHVAEKFSSWMPKLDILRGIGLISGGKAALGLGASPVAAVTAGSVLTASSIPKLAAHAVNASQVPGRTYKALSGKISPYAYELLDTMRDLTPEQMKKFLADPTLATRAFGAVLSSHVQEQSGKEMLLQSQGVK